MIWVLQSNFLVAIAIHLPSALVASKIFLSIVSEYFAVIYFLLSFTLCYFPLLYYLYWFCRFCIMAIPDHSSPIYNLLLPEYVTKLSQAIKSLTNHGFPTHTFFGGTVHSVANIPLSIGSFCKGIWVVANLQHEPTRSAVIGLSFEKGFSTEQGRVGILSVLHLQFKTCS